VSRVVAIVDGNPPTIAERVAGVWAAMSPQPAWSPTLTTSHAIWTDGTNIVVGDSNGLAHWHFDGVSWAQIAATGSHLPKKYASVGGDLWSVSVSRVERFTGGSWTNVTPGGAHTMHSIAVASDDDVYVTGGGIGTEQVWHWNGSTWTNIYSGMLPALGRGVGL